MPKQPATQAQLLAENVALRARLKKAETTLREVLSGEADALFVSGLRGNQLFTLKGADQAYRTLIEEMSEGALTVTEVGVILYANRRFAAMLKLPLKKVIGATLNTWMAPASQPVLQTMLSPHATENRRQQLNLVASDNRQIPVYLSVSKLSGDAMPEAFGLVATDLTEQQRTEDIVTQLRHTERLRRSLEDSIKAIASTVEMRDPYTAGHQRRVGQLAAAIAQELGLSQETTRGIELAASIHDLGKVSIPAEILVKPGKLINLELMLIRTHAQAGFEILKDIEFPWPIASMVLQHHERQDGSGYPQGLKGEQILLESRILAVADVVEAMASHRPYRAALGIDVALQEIERGRSTTYDAAVVDACLRLFAGKRFAFSA
jgi:PAS domain S-box-containing protein